MSYKLVIKSHDTSNLSKEILVDNPTSTPIPLFGIIISIRSARPTATHLSSIECGNLLEYQIWPTALLLIQAGSDKLVRRNGDKT